MRPSASRCCLLLPRLPPGSRAAVWILFPELRGGRCRSSAARANYRQQVSLLRLIVQAARKQDGDALRRFGLTPHAPTVQRARERAGVRLAARWTPFGDMAMRGACMLRRIPPKTLKRLAFFPDVCARAYVVCATAYRMYARPHTGISAREAGKPCGLDTISTGNPGCPPPGIADEQHAGRCESRPLFTAFRGRAARSTRSNGTVMGVSVVPAALPVPDRAGFERHSCAWLALGRLSPADAFSARPAVPGRSG